MAMTLTEKRIRNKSLCLLYTPPCYPGFQRRISTEANTVLKPAFQIPVEVYSENSNPKINSPPNENLKSQILTEKKTESATGLIKIVDRSKNKDSKEKKMDIPYYSINGRLNSKKCEQVKNLTPNKDSRTKRKEQTKTGDIHVYVTSSIIAIAQLSKRHSSILIRKRKARSRHKKSRIDIQQKTIGLYLSSSPVEISDHSFVSGSPNSSDDVPAIKKEHTVSKTSSGYESDVSSNSESDLKERSKQTRPNYLPVGPKNAISTKKPLVETPKTVVILRPPNVAAARRRLNAEKRDRRKSMPARMRDVFNDELIRVFEMDSCTLGMQSSKISSSKGDLSEFKLAANRPETVLQLARKFSTFSAQQEAKNYRGIKIIENENTDDYNCSRTRTKSCAPKLHHSFSTTFVPQPYLKPLGGIASLTRMATTPGSKPTANGGKNPVAIKEALLRWCQSKTKSYPNVNITNFSSSWADGMAFCALVHHFRPNTFDFSKLNPKNRKGNLGLAFIVAEKEADIMPLLEVPDMLMMGNSPDWKCVFTYVQSFYQRFRDED